MDTIRIRKKYRIRRKLNIDDWSDNERNKSANFIWDTKFIFEVIEVKPAAGNKGLGDEPPQNVIM